MRKILPVLLIFSSLGCLVTSPTPPPSSSTPLHVIPTSTATLPAATATPIPTETPQPSILDAHIPTGETNYVLPLTIRHMTEDSAHLFFELDTPVNGVFYYQAVSNEWTETMAIPLTAGETRHQVVLENLSPATSYRALVVIEEQPGELYQPAFLAAPWGMLHFQTMSDEQPLRFGVIGDASFGDEATAALVAEIMTHELDFVIHTGDVVVDIFDNANPPEAYALKYYRTFAPLLHTLPIYTVIGNHDYDAAARWQDSYFYYHAFPPFPDEKIENAQTPGGNQFYAFTHQDVQFLMLDSQVWFKDLAREPQAAFMVERLADSDVRFTIPVFHVPPFFSGAAHPEDQLAIRQFWHPVFAEAQPPLVFSGHSHHYERLAADGITYIVSGGGSGTLYAAGDILPQSQVYGRRTHFVLVEIYSDRIALTAIDKDSEVFDTFVIPLPH